MINLREQVKKAKDGKFAIGHFNTSTLDGMYAIAQAARNLELPVIVGLSEGERDYIGANEAVAIIKVIRQEYNIPIYLNADHTYSFDRVKQAIDTGFDAVIFDGAQLSFEDNIKEAKKCVEYAKKSGRDVMIESELGFIGTSSKLLDAIPDGAVITSDQMTKPEDAKRFVQETGIDMIAPAVGNIHGVVKGGDPALNIKRISELSTALDMPMVLHGASGNTNEDLVEAVMAGMCIVHVNTELRLAYKNGLMKFLMDNPDEVAPYKYLKPARLAMQKVVEDKLKIINML